MAVITLTTNEFPQQVLQKAGSVLVDFSATWCPPCKMLSPILDEVAAEHPELTVCKVDVDQEFQLAVQFQIVNVPTLLLFRDGALQKKSIGLLSKSELLEFLA